MNDFAALTCLILSVTVFALVLAVGAVSMATLRRWRSRLDTYTMLRKKR